MKTELSIEETNKLRIKLGLKPIAVTPSESIQEKSHHEVEEPKKVQPRVLKAQRVDHGSLDNASILEGEIMTLKDANILDEDQNELITESEVLDGQLNKKSESTKKLHQFEGDENENDDDDGEEESYFKVGEARVKLRVNENYKRDSKLKKMEELAKKNNKYVVNLDSGEDDSDDNDDDALDELTMIQKSDFSSSKKKSKSVSAKKFKKSKKNKTKASNGSTGWKNLSDEEIDLNQHVVLDGESIGDDIFDDDNDGLQAVLTASRLKANSKKVKNSEIVKKHQDDGPKKRKLAEVLEDEDDQSDSGLVIDGTSEFLSGLKQNILSNHEHTNDAESTGSQPSNETNGTIENYEHSSSELVKPNGTGPDVEEDTGENSEEDIPSDEPNFGSTGLSSTLSFLQKSSVLKITDEARLKERERTMQKKLKKDLAYMKLASEINGDANNNGHSSTTSIVTEHGLNDYNPEIKITYTDDNNNVLNPKEAYKHLSHKFHGKGPSKQKQAKLLLKKQQKQLKEQKFS
ncbi:hypothetical protein DASC09_046700 [Saccharomycopsis crataegensis]|uniref:Uncharacterized protein n=1 Tax=Saccharomycopsis crataegensis TaxID=43959 RepID=A0AAV5QQX7_9ASCO|nr:hypothetical protein DASC09_046700 [Saccharomycopsis crataegensis]